MKIISSICSILVFVILLASSVLAQPVIYVYTGKVSVTFGWEHTKDPNFHHYELQLRRFGIGDQVVETFSYGTTNLNISILRPRSGTYEGRVKAVNQKLDGGFLESEWCSSLNPVCAKRKDGANGDWKVRWKLSAPLILGPITDQ